MAPYLHFIARIRKRIRPAPSGGERMQNLSKTAVLIYLYIDYRIEAARIGPHSWNHERIAVLSAVKCESKERKHTARRKMDAFSCDAVGEAPPLARWYSNYIVFSPWRPPFCLCIESTAERSHLDGFLSAYVSNQSLRDLQLSVNAVLVTKNLGLPHPRVKCTESALQITRECNGQDSWLCVRQQHTLPFRFQNSPFPNVKTKLGTSWHSTEMHFKQ